MFKYLKRAFEQLLREQQGRLCIDSARLHTEAANLLNHKPGLDFHVKISASKVAPSSGMGVFLMGCSVKKGQVLCLYPGIEIPALPHSASPLDGSTNAITFAREHPKESNYVLNMDMGGTMDAMDSAKVKGSENPYAIGHMVNHSGGRSPNVVVTSFQWRHCMKVPKFESDVLGSVSNQAVSIACTRYHIPNERIAGFWFVDPTSEERVDLPEKALTEAETISEGVSGIAVVSSCDIESGAELLLDYQLRGPPWPDWALPWYQPAVYPESLTKSI